MTKLSNNEEVTVFRGNFYFVNRRFQILYPREINYHYYIIIFGSNLKLLKF